MLRYVMNAAEEAYTMNPRDIELVLSAIERMEFLILLPIKRGMSLMMVANTRVKREFPYCTLQLI
jgi:hypothetical protein